MKAIMVNTVRKLELCLAVRQQVFVIEQGVPAEIEIDQYDTTPHECVHVLIIDDNGKGVATGRMVPYGENTAKFQRIAVCKEMRGRNLGRDIVEMLEEQAKSSGLLHVILDAQCSAEKFYSKIGYTTVSAEPFSDAGIWHVRMKKKLITI